MLMKLMSLLLVPPVPIVGPPAPSPTIVVVGAFPMRIQFWTVQLVTELPVLVVPNQIIADEVVALVLVRVRSRVAAEGGQTVLGVLLTLPLMVM